MPGGQAFEQVGENQFSGVLQVKVGPVQGTFQGKIELSDVKPPESYQIQVDGKGAAGYVKATGSLKLEARGSQTYMEYSGQAQIGGRIASVGQRLLETTARSIIRQSLDALNEYLKVEVAQQAQQQQSQSPGQQSQQSQQVQQSSGTDADPTTSRSTIGQAAIAASLPTYKPPTQMQLAFNVARDVLNDLIPTQYQPAVIGGVIVVILLLAWLVLRR